MLIVVSLAGRKVIEGVPAHATGGPRAVCAPISAPRHGAGGHYHGAHVLLHAQAPR